MRKRIVVTGLGVISPLGNDVESFWGDLLAGKSGVEYITHYDTSEHKTKFAANVKGFDAAALFGAARGAPDGPICPICPGGDNAGCSRCGLEITDDNRDRIGCVIGSGIGGISTIFEQVQVFCRAWAIPGQPIPGADDDPG